MLQRPLLFTGIMTAAVGVPYVLFSENMGPDGAIGKLIGRGDGSSSAWNWSGESSDTASPGALAAPVPIEQAFRFDLSPEWVALQWPRVTTVLGETGRMGMRVALVSGTQPDDIAGSLTYYFDEHHQVQRITFQGLTGDDKKLVTLLTSQHGLRPAPTLGAGLYTATDAAGKTSRLYANHLPVVRATTPNTRVELTVELYRPAVDPSAVAAASQAGSNAPGTTIHPKAAGTRLMQRLRSW